MNEYEKFLRWLPSKEGIKAIKKAGLNPEELPEVLENIFGKKMVK